MTPKFFTVDQANALLPELRTIIEKLQGHQSRVQHIMQNVEYPIPPTMYNLGSKDGSKLVNEFIAIENLIGRLQTHGCILKDINLGLVDFLSEVDGDEVWLSWSMDEDSVNHYHNLEKGFSDRQPLV